MVFQFNINWQSPGSPGGTSVLHTDTETNIGVFIANFAVAWQTVATQFPTTVSWSFDGNFTEHNTATGVLVDAGNIGTTGGDSGDGASPPMANASQVLIRWSTNGIVRGRRVRGRTYLPGASVANLSNGEFGSAQVVNFSNAFQQAINGGALSIWSRPINGAGGSLHTVTGAQCWNELAVLRRRR